MNVIDDFIKIKNHLGLPEKLSLEIEFTHPEGFYYSSRPSVMIGVKNGYKRTLLVHECLHAIGLNHYNPPDFESVIKHDKYSAKIEEEIFAVVPKE